MSELLPASASLCLCLFLSTDLISACLSDYFRACRALDLDLTPSSYWAIVQEAEQQFPQYQARKDKLWKTLEQLVLRDEEESEYTHTNTVSFYANHHPDIFGSDLTDNDTSAVNTPRRYSQTQPLILPKVQIVTMESRDGVKTRGRRFMGVKGRGSAP